MTYPLSPAQLAPAADVDAVLNGYIDCALWSESIGEDFAAQWHAEREPDSEAPAPDVSLESFGFTADDVDSESLAAMREDVEAFISDPAIRSALRHWSAELGDAQIGHDFWLTRNRHGAGFWDRFAGGVGADYGRALTDTAHPYGESHLYVGDDLETVYVD
jgi:hypothetical protein